MKNLTQALFLIYVLFTIDKMIAQPGIVKYLTSYQSSLGGNSTMLNGIYSIQANPAGIVENDMTFSVMVNTEQRFFLSILNSSFIGATRKLGQYDAVGLSLSRFGIAEYKEQKLSMSYSRKITEQVSLGTNFNFHNFRIQGYGSKAWLNISLGLKSSLSKSISAGFFARNLFPHRLQSHTSDILILAFGIQYILSEKVFLVCELQKPGNRSIFLSFGLNYHIIENLNLQGGVNSADSGTSFGFIYRINTMIELSGGIRSNQHLGSTPFVGFVFHFI